MIGEGPQLLGDPAAAMAVLIAGLVYRKAEAIGRRTLVAALLVVAGGALVTAFR